MNYIDIIVSSKVFPKILKEPLFSIVVPIGSNLIPETLNDIYKISTKSTEKIDYSEWFCFYEPFYIKNIRLKDITQEEWNFSIASSSVKKFLKTHPEETIHSEVVIVVIKRMHHDLCNLGSYNGSEKKNI